MLGHRQVSGERKASNDDPLSDASRTTTGIEQMTESIGWLLLLGLAIAIAGIYMLSSRIEKHARSATESMIYSNEMILTELKRLADPSAEAPESTIGVILERRQAPRRKRLTSISQNRRMAEQRISPGRRYEDPLTA